MGDYLTASSVLMCPHGGSVSPVAGNTTLSGTTPTFGGTVAGAGNDLTLNFSGRTAIDGATFTGIRNVATGNGGSTSPMGALRRLPSRDHSAIPGTTSAMWASAF